MMASVSTTSITTVNSITTNIDGPLQVSTLEEKCKEMMMLKFGRVVDLEQLENVTVNKLAEELQRKIKEQEKTANKELTELKVITQ